MLTRSVGIIGFGAIGRSLVDTWKHDALPGYRLTALLTRPGQSELAKEIVPEGVRVVTSMEEFFSERVDIVIEAAGHSAVLQSVPIVLRDGGCVMILSVGALVDDDFRMSMMELARHHRGRMVIPVGAIAGLDGLLALRRAGLQSVSYTATKPPASWKGTIAEESFDLDRLTEPAVLFEGKASHAARLYPKNANLSATIALAGLGLERTHVRLIADPKAQGNSGHLLATGTTGTLSVVVDGRQSPGNPKTSLITPISVISSLSNEDSVLSFR